MVTSNVWQVTYRLNHEQAGFKEQFVLGDITEDKAKQLAEDIWGYRRRMLAQDLWLADCNINKLGLPPDSTRVPAIIGQYGQGEWEGRLPVSTYTAICQMGMLVKAWTEQGKVSRRVYRAIPESWVFKSQMRGTVPFLQEMWNQRHPAGIIGQVENVMLINRVLNFIYQNTYLATVKDFWTDEAAVSPRRHPTSWELHPYTEWQVIRPTSKKVGRKWAPFKGTNKR